MASQPAGDALARLVDKNSKLYGQLQVQRARIHQLESRQVFMGCLHGLV